MICDKNEYSKRAIAAMEYFHDGYNCAQSVVLAFADLISSHSCKCGFGQIPKETILAVSGPFGGGMGRLREVCGAVSGMFMVIGYLYGQSCEVSKKDAADAKSVKDAADATSVKEAAYVDADETLDENELARQKKIQYSRVQELAKRFEEKNGSIICRELTGLAPTGPSPEQRNDEYYKKRPCEALVGDAVEILEAYIEKNPY